MPRGCMPSSYNVIPCRCTFSQEGAVGDIIITGVFLSIYPYFYSNEVVTVQVTQT